MDSYVYTYNVGNQRTQLQRSGMTSASYYNYVNYTYDPIGEVVSDLAYENGGGLRHNEQLRYVFDPAGNLIARTNNALRQGFQVNTLNELTTNTNGGSLTVMGTTTSTSAGVTVNGDAAAIYDDATFVKTGLAFTINYTAIATDAYGRYSTNSVTVNLSTNVSFQYDLNGDLTNDGLLNLAYDDENQLTQVWVSNQWMSKFTYDGKMRRRIRDEYVWSSAIRNWSLTNEVRYVYDGNLVIQERDMNNLPTTTYTRGKDLSGSLEGAGGVGDLLARTAQSYVDAPMAGHSFYHADGNGNITMLINSSQAIVAKYLYDAFGNVLSASGILANANRYQFSSKEKDLNSGLAYYLYRFYDPNLQRWINRDPIGEKGGVDLYRFVRNDSINLFDRDGRKPVQCPDSWIIHCAVICRFGTVPWTQCSVNCLGDDIIVIFNCQCLPIPIF